MGCLQSAESKENLKFQAQQQKAFKDDQRAVKVLLLGTGDSGKTTLRKQMRCIYGEGFSEQTRKQVGPVVLSNLIDGVNEILRALNTYFEDLKLPEELKPHADFVSKLEANPNFLSPELSDHLKKLIGSETFIEAVKRRRMFQLQDCWLEFSKNFMQVPNWGSETWIPTTEECVSVRVRTSGIVEESFIIDKVKFDIFDVGGQRAERRKWIHSFDNVTAVLFITAISEYDQGLFEDREKNRLVEALDLFEEICNSRWFQNVPIIMFLNKKDLFEKKLLEDKVPLNISGCFQNAPEGNVDVKTAIDWISQQFLKRKKDPSKAVFTYVTTATDSSNIKTVFDVCRSIILKQSLVKSGFIESN